MKLFFPSYNFKIKKVQNTNYIYDIIRKKFVVLTPEEWVRQHLCWYLIDNLNYPKSLIAIEKRILVNGKSKRFDLVVYHTLGKPLLLAECKAPTVAVNIDSFIQAGQYNQRLGAPLLVVTNGIELKVIEYNLAFDSYKTSQIIPVYT